MDNKIVQEINKIEIPKKLRERTKMGVSDAKFEMNKKKKHRRIVFAAPVLAASLALAIAVPNFITDSPPKNPIIKTIEGSSVIDTSNPKSVVGFSDNVFIGKVIKQVDTRNDIYPETQFEVQVLDNIKGELSGNIKVNQAGGYDGEYLFLMDGDPLLKEGQTYVFATRYLKEENWHTLIPVGGDIPFHNEAEKKELIEKYKLYYKEEIPFKLN
jgi:hypothetical protein